MTMTNRVYLTQELGRVQARIRAYMKSRDEGDPATLLNAAMVLREKRSQLIHARHQACEEGSQIPFHGIAQRFELSAVDEDILWHVLAYALSPNTRQLLDLAQGSAHTIQHALHVAFISELLFPDPALLGQQAWADEGSRLVASGILQVLQQDRHTIDLAARSLRVPHYLVRDVIGQPPGLDLDMQTLCELHQVTSRDVFSLSLPATSRRTFERLVQYMERLAKHNQPSNAPVLLLSGPRLAGKTHACQVLAHHAHRPLLTMHCDSLVEAPQPLQTLQRVFHNASYLNAIWHLTTPKALDQGTRTIQRALTTLIERYPGCVFIESVDAEAASDVFYGLISARFAMTRPQASERAQILEGLIPLEVPLAIGVDGLHEIANRFDLPGGQLKTGFQSALAQSGHTLGLEDLHHAMQTQLRPGTDRWSTVSHAHLGFDDLVLPSDVDTAVRSLLSACRNRATLLNQWGFDQRLSTGRGILALFYGDSGTGKTLCAEIIARELGQTLRIINLAKVVSKWVGESEKNMTAILEQARAEHAMLLFDEADALFGNRVETSSGQDRYNNMAINHLLHEIERYEGVAILTTNFKENIDEAFMRRLNFKIEFPKPQAPERALLWQKLIPKQTPRTGTLNYESLARFELTGGQIKNALIRACYACLENSTGLTHQAIAAAARHEVVAANRLVNEHDWHFDDEDDDEWQA